MNDIRLINFRENGDDRGRLVIIDGINDIPFEIKRVFYIYGSEKGVMRGRHANRKSEFILINVKGTSKIMVNNGMSKQVFTLDKPHMGIYLPKMVWKNMYDFSTDSILLVLASEHYDPSEYITDFEQFMKETHNFSEQDIQYSSLV